MGNRFYGAFDQETWGGGRRPDYRSCFQVDRDRVIHAHAFRKLQSKTQVFLSGEYDFYRTRLTHSIEVAQIGRSICTWLLSRGEPLEADFFIDSDLVEAVCLAHDLGHPPFGHSGERTLQELMRPHGGFEGNAQTLHLIAETMFQNESGVRGMQPTRALMDGVLKYKRLYSEFTTPPKSHFLYDPQSAYRDFVFGGATPESLARAGEALNHFKSVECQIMDWADDAAYSLNDIVDGVRAGFLTIERIEAWAAETGVDAERQGWLDRLFAAIRGDRLEEEFSQKIGGFIKACRLRDRGGRAERSQAGRLQEQGAGEELWGMETGRTEREQEARANVVKREQDAPATLNPMAARTNRYRFELVVAPEAEREAAFYKRMANDIIFESPQLQQMEHKARKILFELWDAAWRNYVEPGAKGARVIRLLPPRVGRLVDAAETEAGKARQICDWLAGLTDGMIVRTYRRLHDPDFGSIRDLS